MMANRVAFAQEGRGSIVGKISDASGAAIPAAPVVVTNKAMGTAVTQSTNETGYYQATFLIPGIYRISVAMPGFKEMVRDGVEVRVNDRLEVNLALEIGASEQTITVTAETPLLNTATASTGQVIDARRVSELPTPHGNPFFLIGLAGGVTFNRDQRLDRPFEPTHIAGYSIDGTRANRSDITIDGVPATATANAGEVTASYVPPSDIIAEFKVQTATFDAQFGQTEGGVTNMVIKSGTNDLHGTAYFNKMVPEMFANDWFANRAGVARADFTYNRWGGSAGGPVVLPKLYNGRNKTFFLWGYEGIDEARPRNNGTPTVPTAKMKQGDFSELLPGIVIYNPFTRRQVGSRFEADPFPGNIIPQSLINPIARNILKYYPDPLQPGNSSDRSNNYQRPDLLEKAAYWTHTVRADHFINDKHRIFVRGSFYNRDSDYNNYFDNLATGNWFQFQSRAGVFDDVYTFSPSVVLNVRYGYNRFIRVTEGNPESFGFDLTSLGFPQSYSAAVPPDIRQFPRIDLTGYQGTAIGGEFRPNDTHSLASTLNISKSSHYMKTGFEFRSYRENSVFYGNDQVGRFVFDSTWTRGPLDNSPAAPNSLGQSVAALLLGLPSGANSGVIRNPSYAEQSTTWGFFFQDDWKVSSKLTLNLGLRWEYETALTERYNRSVRGFDPNFVQPIEAQAQARYAANRTPEVPQLLLRGGLTFAGVNGEPSSLYNTPTGNWMPRFGFAYQLSPKTVVRGGYGMFYGFLGQRRGDVVQSGFSRLTPFNATTDNINFTNTLSDPFPNGILEPLGAAQGAETFLGQGIWFFNQNPLSPRMQRWQMQIQRELFGGFVMELGYVGNKGIHIEMVRDLNATPLGYLSTSPNRDVDRINYLSANLPNPFVGLMPAGAVNAFTAANIARERLLRPYPQFDQVRTTNYDGYSWYHSLQMQLEKRFSRGYTISGSYTLSKFMQATEYLNASDPLPTEVISDFDTPHRVAVSGIWELPFGRGRRLFAQAPRIASTLISGWQLGAIYTFQSGPPIPLSYTTSTVQGYTLVNPGSLIFNGDLANIRSGVGRDVDAWINRDAGFVLGAAGQLDLGRQIRTFPLRLSSVRGDNINNWDMSVIKNTRIGERMNVQFKGEFLNAMNHPLFPNPITDPANANFGRITNVSNQANYPRRVQLTLKLLF